MSPVEAIGRLGLNEGFAKHGERANRANHSPDPDQWHRTLGGGIWRKRATARPASRYRFALCPWMPVIGPLVDHFRLIIPDLRGHGDSDKPANGYLFTDYADDLAGLFEAYEIKRPFILGHSLGALTSLFGLPTILRKPRRSSSKTLPRPTAAVMCPCWKAGWRCRQEQSRRPTPFTASTRNGPKKNGTVVPSASPRPPPAFSRISSMSARPAVMTTGSELLEGHQIAGPDRLFCLDGSASILEIVKPVQTFADARSIQIPAGGHLTAPRQNCRILSAAPPFLLDGLSS